MAGRSLDRTRSELTDFLIHHRSKLTPADVGLPSTGRRRTPGLRREEVATLAGVGLTWYTWFEQGRDINVSESFVLRVSKALKLDDAECCHLFLLAHRRPPPVEAYQWQEIPPLVQRLMDDMPRPAYVMNLRWDVSTIEQRWRRWRCACVRTGAKPCIFRRHGVPRPAPRRSGRGRPGDALGAARAARCSADPRLGARTGARRRLRSPPVPTRGTAARGHASVPFCPPPRAVTPRPRSVPG